MNSNDTRLTVAISNIIISEGLYFDLAKKPRFKKVLDLEMNFSRGYQSPNRNIIYKYLLYLIHDNNMESNLSLIKKGSDIFRLSFLGDGANISIDPLLKILVSEKYSIIYIITC